MHPSEQTGREIVLVVNNHFLFKREFSPKDCMLSELGLEGIMRTL
jgi:hypothetical protein